MRRETPSLSAQTLVDAHTAVSRLYDDPRFNKTTLNKTSSGLQNLIATTTAQERKSAPLPSKEIMVYPVNAAITLVRHNQIPELTWRERLHMKGALKREKARVRLDSIPPSPKQPRRSYTREELLAVNQALLDFVLDASSTIFLSFAVVREWKGKFAETALFSMIGTTFYLAKKFNQHTAKNKRNNS